MESSTSEPTFHALLVGIDDYPSKPLGGCVNDIDRVQRVLLEHVGVPAERIRRLASPRPNTRHDTTVPEQPATLDNLRTAFVALGSEAVAPGDRVFIYYSGHGARMPMSDTRGGTVHRESLVPADVIADHDEPRMLFDFELNALLGNILARTRNLTVVLDACHSQGATRSSRSQVARCLDVVADLRLTRRWPDPAGVTRSAATPAVGLAPWIDDCQVVAACLGHEQAQEGSDPDGTRYGVLTRSFVDAVEAAAATDDLRTMTWGRIWQDMCAAVEQRSPWQHLWMEGDLGRSVFGGAPVARDVGFSVTRPSPDRYEIAAGTLADVTPAAQVAIYGDRPAYFPPLGSEAERAARIGVLRVIAADRARATAEAVGAAFELPPGARGRVVQAGTAARLRCSVVPANAAVQAQLIESPLLEVVDNAPVRLEQLGDRWLLTDEVHEARPDLPILFALEARELDRARALLEHYYSYARPLRMAAYSTDLLGELQLKVLSAPSGDWIRPSDVQTAHLLEAPTRATAAYVLAEGDEVCMQVRNTSSETLRVTLLNVAASGKVQLLGDQIVDAGSSYVFWAGRLGVPFAMTAPPGIEHCIDRLVAIGRTAMGADLGYLRIDRTFAEVAAAPPGSKDIGGIRGSRAAPVERWTAAQAIIETRVRRGVDIEAR